MIHLKKQNLSNKIINNILIRFLQILVSKFNAILNCQNSFINK